MKNQAEPALVDPREGEKQGLGLEPEERSVVFGGGKGRCSEIAITRRTWQARAPL